MSLLVNVMLNADFDFKCHENTVSLSVSHEIGQLSLLGWVILMLLGSLNVQFRLKLSFAEFLSDHQSR